MYTSEKKYIYSILKIVFIEQLLKWVAAAAFIFLVLIIGILAYYLIEEKIKNEDLNTKLVKVENRYNDAMLSLHNTKIFWINEERAKIYMGQELYSDI